MEFTIITKSFNLHDLKANYCYHFVKSSSENGDEIKFTIDRSKIGSFVSCLIMQNLKFDALYQSSANLMVKTEIIQAKMEHFRRILTMIRELVSIINQSSDVTLEDLNN